MANITIKPFRDYDEHEVINLFTLAPNSGDAGQLVALQGSGYVSTADPETASLTSQAGVYSMRYSNPSKVSYPINSATRTGVIGILLKNVRETDYLGRSLLYDATRAVEANAVPSGQTVPILTRGLIMVSGVSGTVTPGCGAIAGVGTAGVADGGWQVVPSNSTGSIGTFLGNLDGNGYALFKLSL